MNVAHVFATLLLVLCCSFAQGANLYPACEGREVHGSVGAGGETTVHVVPLKAENLTLTCLAYEVTSLRGGMSRRGYDPCSVEHQTEFLYRLVIRAKWKNKTTKDVMMTEYDVKDLAGGSIGDIAIRTPGESEFSLVFKNQASHRRCSLRVRAIMDYKLSAKEVQSTKLPVVVSVVPRTVYTRRTETTMFFLKYPEGTDMKKASKDIVALSDLDNECADGKFNGRVMRLPSVKQDSYFVGKSFMGERDYYFDRPEAYRICYRGEDETTSSELAVVRVFDGNPSYYQVVDGQDDDGRVLVGVTTTIKFYGYDLDTRPDGDRAKFAYDSEDCATASPAGGVPEATDLGPSDDYGPNTTYTLWTWTLREGGAFKICYKRRDAHWTEVPSIADVAPTPAPTAAPSNVTHVPQPTDPVTKIDCPMAPESTREEPWVAYKSVKLTLNGTRAPEGFLQTISRVFCIPRAALAVTHMTHDTKGLQVLYISIVCEDLGEARPCDTLERQNYIVSLGKENSSILSDIAIVSIEGSTHMFAFGDDPIIIRNYNGHVMAISITCITVLLITAMGVYGVLKYRENRQYFIQFGADDEDVGDMYAISGSVKGGDEYRRPVKDSVIEVEE
ncbi:golgi/lysosome glycoprotein [Trypanosoma grayi]|uniref:golgi/lysosome glycoprotein n=1 Tax=Trypanosoma grayi TaxID=71804 RepID=UPI0004F4380D|nr:golgi/lysosome glycoprotein [Trypanosoma grayi]KEG13341.1 golgi/lysosome glycoprotein [Trypanosoma grayi]